MINSRMGLFGLVVLSIFTLLIPGYLAAAPYAAVVMDARNGKVIYSRNGNTQLHPASLTKMMTLYIAFAEIEAGRLRLDQKVVISKNAASQPPSKIGLRAGSSMEVRYLLRAAAIKSANDAATAIGDAIAGNEAQFSEYMTQTARALGMKNTRFKNANGLTASGHMSTAYDMAILGRRIVYDFPRYYNLFSRDNADTPLGKFSNSNVRFLKDYPGADGIKTGYTRAAGYNLVATSRRGNERIIVSMFGGQSSYQRNEQVGALLDLGFREAPSNVKVSNLKRVRLAGVKSAPVQTAAVAPKPQASAGISVSSKRLTTTLNSVVRPVARPNLTRPSAVAAVALSGVEVPIERNLEMGSNADEPIRTVSASSNQGGYSIQLDAVSSKNDAEKELISASLAEMDTLSTARNQIVTVSLSGRTMYRPRFSGISEVAAYRACAKFQARQQKCYVIAPS